MCAPGGWERQGWYHLTRAWAAVQRDGEAGDRGKAWDIPVRGSMRNTISFSQFHTVWHLPIMIHGRVGGQLAIQELGLDGP